MATAVSNHFPELHAVLSEKVRRRTWTCVVPKMRAAQFALSSLTRRKLWRGLSRFCHALKPCEGTGSTLFWRCLFEGAVISAVFFSRKGALCLRLPLAPGACFACLQDTVWPLVPAWSEHGWSWCVLAARHWFLRPPLGLGVRFLA